MAIELYALNIRVSQILYGALHGYEITLRNAMNDRLKQHFGQEAWYEKANLKFHHTEMVAKAKLDAAIGWPSEKARRRLAKCLRS